MFVKEFEIEGVNQSFDLQNEGLYVLLKSNEILKYDVERKAKVWVSDMIENITTMGILSNNIFCNTGFAIKIISSFSGEILNQYNFKVIFSLPYSENFLAVSKNNGKKILKLMNKEFFSLSERDIKVGKSIAVNDDIFVNTKYLNDQVIVGYNLQSFEELWEVNISHYAQFTDIRQEHQEGLITHILGVCRGVLWFGLSSGKLLGLKIKTGDLEDQIGFKESDLSQFPYEVKEGDYLPFGELVQLDEEKEQIIGLRDKYFMRVKLSTPGPVREYINVGESMDAHKISSSYRNYSFPCDDQFIYFCDDRQGKIGVFDRVKQEVVWSYELEMERVGIAQILEMKYSNGRWYVLDRNHTLHIFKRE